MEKIPTLQELDEFYTAYSYQDDSYLSPLTIQSYNVLLDEFEPFRKTNKILDVGCGLGWFLLEAKKRGWEVYGTEFSKTAVKLCKENGIEMKEGVLNPAEFDLESFDVITSFEVIEHVNNPNEEIAAIKKLLRQGGLFYCTTPNFDSVLRFYLKTDYNIITYPEHLSYYTKSTLNQLAANHSLKPFQFLSTGISLTRLKTSTGKSNEKMISIESADEILRNSIANKWYLRFAKEAINKLLTWTNTGMTLKGYYVKK